MRTGDLIEYSTVISGSVMVETGIVVEVDHNEGKCLLLRVQWLNAIKPEWIIYDKKIIKLIAQA
jgi:hypothetical protein